MRKHLKIKQEEVIFLFFSAYVFLVNYMQIFAHQQIGYLYPLFITLNILILVYYLLTFDRKKELGLPRIRWIEFVFLLLVFFIDFSKIYHMEYNFVLLTFIIFGKLIPMNTHRKEWTKIIYINLVGIYPFLLYAIYSFNHYPSYYNNSMGVLLSVNSYFIIILLSVTLRKQQKKESILLALYLLVSLVTTYNTGSRTAILASILMVFYFIYSLRKIVKYMDKEKLLLALPGIIGLLYVARNQFINIFNNLFFKWDGNGLDFSFTGRTGIWAYTLKNYKIFGGGKNFFLNELNVSHGHNVVFSILGFYGVIPFVLMLLILVYGLYMFIKIDRLSVRLYMILFVVINAFEGVIGGVEYSYFQLLFFLHFGLLMKELNKQNSRE